MKQLLFVVLLLLFIGCSDKPDFIEYDCLAPQEIKLDRIKLENEILYCDNIYVYDDKLIILNAKNKNGFLSLYSLDDLNYLGDCGIIGRGPNEFDFINTNATASGYCGINITESISYSSIDITMENQNPSIEKKEIVRLPNRYSAANSLLMLSDSTTIIYMNNNENVEFYIHNRCDKTTKPISYYPKYFVNGGRPSSTVCSTLFLNDLCINTTDNRFAAIYSQLPMVRIFENTGVLRSTSLLKKWREQHFNFNKNEVMTSENIQYYLASCANNNYICGLYLGKSPDDMQDTNMEDVRMELHVWNWDGELVAIYLPDKLINHIALSNDNTLYAVSLLDDKNIYKYKL